MSLKTVKLGEVEVTRLVIGGNPFSGFSHQGGERDREMRRYYTAGRIREALAKAEAAGVNTFFGRVDNHVMRLMEEYWDEGGKLKWIAQTCPEMTSVKRSVQSAVVGRAAAVYVHGGYMDRALAAGELDDALRGLEAVREAGLPAGIAGHNPEVQRWAEREKLVEIAKRSIETAGFSLKLFEDVVLKNQVYFDLILSEAFTHQTYYMGLVDENNHVNFYDGQVRVVDPEGSEFVKYSPEEYVNVLAEHVEPWTYLKFPYLKEVGWKGFVTGMDSGIYQATPLSRLNAADEIATPLAQAEYERFYDTLGGKADGAHPVVHATLTTH